MKASIVIVNWKVKELLGACLDSVRQHFCMSQGDYEIIVVDNNSEDGSNEMLRDKYLDITLIANDVNVGFGKANNQAFLVAQGDCIILLNPDTYLFEDSFSPMLEQLQQDPRIAAIGCRLLNADRSLQRWTGGAFPSLWNVACHYLFLHKLLPQKWRPNTLYLDDDIAKTQAVDWVSGACMVLRREALNNQLFDERFFMYGEDMALCYRLKKSGWDVVYTPETSLIHYQGRSMAKQSGNILSSSIKGPRMFFVMTHSRWKLPLFDVLTIMGFVVRLFGYSAKALLNRAKYQDKVKSSWQYVKLSFRVLFKG